MKKLLALLMLIFLVISGCGQEEEKLGLKVLAMTRLVKRATMDIEGSLSYLPQGVFGLGLMFMDKNDQYLKGHEKIVKAEIYAPDGTLFKTLRHNSPFNLASRTYLDGFIIYGKNLQHYLLNLVDLTLDMKYLPEAGKYTFKITATDGEIYTVQREFTPQANPPLKGFPTQIRFDAKTRLITFKAPEKGSSFQILLFEGEKKDNIDWSALLYSSGWERKTLSKPEYRLPDTVKLEKGVTYHILVDVIDSALPQDANYLFTQDRPEEIAQFVY